jgi:hypothetical protein
MMLRCWRRFLFMVVLLAPSPLWAQTRPSLLYSLPPDGTWVEYEVKGSRSKQPISGTLRVACFGSQEVNKVKYRWIEVKLEIKKGVDKRIEIFKMKIDEKALEGGPAWAGNVVEVHQKVDAKAPVKLPPQQGEEFLSMGCIDGDVKLAVKKEKASVTTSKETLTCKEVEANCKRSDGQIDYLCWLNSTVPFGWARINTVTRLKDEEVSIFTATYVQKGTGAKSELDAK